MLIIFVGFGFEFWEILAGCGWSWVVMADFRVIVAGFGSLWVVFGGFGSFLLLVCTFVYIHNLEVEQFVLPTRTFKILPLNGAC